MLDRRAMLLALTAGGAGCATSAAAPNAQTSPIPALHPLARFIGRWRGRGSGEPGDSQVERTYAPILAGRFIEERNRSVYPPQARNPPGEVHTHLGLWSFDRARGRIVFRQFHQEGFVNQYLAATADFVGDTLLLESEAIENIPAGFRARETYKFTSADTFEEVFEIAEPGRAYALYSRNILARDSAGLGAPIPVVSQFENSRP